MAEQWTIEYYQTANGRSPVTAEIDELPVKDAAKVYALITELETHGLAIGKHLRGSCGSFGPPLTACFTSPLPDGVS